MFTFQQDQYVAVYQVLAEYFLAEESLLTMVEFQEESFNNSTLQDEFNVCSSNITVKDIFSAWINFSNPAKLIYVNIWLHV